MKIIYMVLLLTGFIFCCTTRGFAQNKTKTVKGTVTNSKTGVSLVGANVLVMGTTTGTITNVDGHYSVNVSSLQDTLRISYIGYQTKTVPINGRTTINVALKPQIISGQQLVVVGYGTRKEGDVSSAIATVDVEQLQEHTVLPNIGHALQGTTAGVSVTPASGAPGASLNIHIRGVNTFGNSKPLVIINGVPGKLSTLNPSDIKSISILKDAASAAIYGSRAANGVILVKTKDGSPGKTNVTIKTSYGAQLPMEFLSLLNATQYVKVINALHRSAGQPIYSKFSDPATFGKGTNWQKSLFSPAPILHTYIGISGGSDNSTYRVSGSYDRRGGISLNTWSSQAVVHYSGQQNTGIFTLNENLSLTKVNTRYQEKSGLNTIFYTLYAQPIFPIHDSTNLGGFGGTPNFIPYATENPVGNAVMFKNYLHNLNLNVGINGSFQFLKYFTYKLNLGYSLTDSYTYNYRPTYYYNNSNRNVHAFLNENRSRNIHWLVGNTLNFEKQIGKNKITAMVGYTFEKEHFRNTGGSMTGFPNNELHVLSAGTGFGVNIYGRAHVWTLQSILGRIDYSFGNKYFATFNIRRDGSSRFGEGERYGIFPSVSVAWRLSSEKFFQTLKDVIQNLKLRVSYGILGNEPSNYYGSIPTVVYNPNLGYLIGGRLASGAAIISFANPNIAWETTKSLDFGIDIRFLNNFTITSDYYIGKTSDLLLAVPIPPSSGASDSPPVVNTGKLKNKGFEFSLSYHSDMHENFNYTISGNFSTTKNRVVKLGYAGQVIWGTPTRRSLPVTLAKAGYPIGAFFVMQTAGLFRSQEEVNNWTNDQGELLQPNAEPGDVRYIDVNGDGEITTDDVEFSGSPIPDFSYGLNFTFNYKNFDFSLFIQGTYGNKMFDSNTWLISKTTNEYNHSTALLDAWSPDNPDGTFPRLTFTDPNRNSLPSDRFLFDASYLRLKSLQLGYTLPIKGSISKIGNLDIRIFINAYNLFTITNYPGYDPSYTGNGLIDRGLDAVRYPLSRIVTGGININF